MSNLLDGRMTRKRALVAVNDALDYICSLRFRAPAEACFASFEDWKALLDAGQDLLRAQTRLADTLEVTDSQETPSDNPTP